MSVHRRGSMWRVYAALTGLAIVMIGAMLYVLHTGTQLSVQYGLLIDAAMSIRLEATTSHLRLEEMLHGERSGDLEDVERHLRVVDQGVQIMLEGGERSGHAVVALDDPALRRRIRVVQERLADLRVVTGELWSAAQAQIPAPEAAQRYHSSFDELLGLIEEVQSDVQRTLAREIRTFQRLQGALIAASVALSILVGVVCRSHITARRRAEDRERLMSAAVGQSTEGIAVVDLDGKLLSLNHAFAVMHGYSPEELVGEYLSIFHTPEQMSAVEAANRQIEETGQFSGEIWHVKRDGTVFPTLMHNSLLRAESGAPMGMIGAVRDDTERRRAEENLHEETRLSTAALNSLPGAFYLFDEQGRYLRWNDNLATVSGYSSDEIREMHPLDFFAESDRPLIQDRIEEVFTRGEATVEVRLVAKDGTSRPYYFTGKRVVIRGQTCLVGMGIDISERKSAEEALRDSERRFRLLADNVPGVIYLCRNDERYTMLYLSDAVETLTGYPKEEFLEDRISFTDLYHPDDAPAVHGGVDQALAERRAFHFAYRFRHRSGEWRWVEEHGVGVWSEDGRELLYLEGFLSDVTDSRRAVEALRDSEELLRTVINAAKEAMISIGEDGLISLFNPAAEEMFGRKRAEMFGKPLDCLMPEEYRERHRGYVSSYFAKGEPHQAIGRILEMPGLRNDGSEFSMEISLSAGRHGESRFIIAVARDITERRQAEQERRRLEAQIQHAQKLESLGVLAGGIAHDFNNLLVGILGHAGLAQMDLPPESPARGAIERIEMAAQRAADLARQMLAYSGRGRFIIEPLDLSALVEEMAHLLEVAISKKVMLRFDLSAGLPAVEADATQIRQVVMNLITNASDALEGMSGVVAVSTGAMEADRAYLSETYLDEDLQEGYFAYIEVTDTGAGMDRETVAKIFDPFFTTKFAGRGLGLAAVLGIVRGHAGALKVTSTPGKGTTFRVLLPCGHDGGRAVEGGIGGESMREPQQRGSGTILVADDEEVVRTVAKMTLEKSGFTVVTARDGEEAVAVFRDHVDEVVAVLLDMTMPRLSGEEAFREMRRIRADVPVLLSSGYNQQEAIGRFAGEGLAGFVQKPYRPQDLIDKVRSVLEG